MPLAPAKLHSLISSDANLVVSTTSANALSNTHRLQCLQWVHAPRIIMS